LIVTLIVKNFEYYEPTDDVPKKLYCFWTGNNPMSEKRKTCLKNLEKTGMEVILVTSENLPQYLVEPLHRCYKYLSETHKADYLRTYFMHFHGGAYCDIKTPTKDWIAAYNELLKDKTKYANGTKEIGGGVPDIHGDLALNEILQREFDKLISLGGFIFRKNTPYTQEWYKNLMIKMDQIADKLEKYPSTCPQQTYSDGYPYPLRWAELLGEIFHPVCYKYKDRILQTVPPLIYTDYR